jgi:hypothetical protein
MRAKARFTAEAQRRRENGKIDFSVSAVSSEISGFASGTTRLVYLAATLFGIFSVSPHLRDEQRSRWRGYCSRESMSMQCNLTTEPQRHEEDGRIDFSVTSVSSVISEFASGTTRRLFTFTSALLKVFSVPLCLCGELC